MLLQHGFNCHVTLQVTYKPSYSLPPTTSASDMKSSPNALPPPPADMTDAVYGGPGDFGMDPSIQSIDRGYIKVEHKAKFKKICCDHCNYTLNRKYFSVLENSYEYNHPMGFHCLCFVLPPNCCCPGFDCITKSVTPCYSSSASSLPRCPKF